MPAKRSSAIEEQHWFRAHRQDHQHCDENSRDLVRLNLNHEIEEGISTSLAIRQIGGYFAKNIRSVLKKRISDAAVRTKFYYCSQ